MGSPGESPSRTWICGYDRLLGRSRNVSRSVEHVSVWLPGSDPPALLAHPPRAAGLFVDRLPLHTMARKEASAARRDTRCGIGRALVLRRNEPSHTQALCDSEAGRADAGILCRRAGDVC